MPQLDIFQESKPNKVVHVQNGAYLYIPHFLKIEESDFYYSTFLHHIEWKQENISMFGKTLPFPRLTAWYGNTGKSYRYSGKTYQPTPWTTELLSLKESVEKASSVSFTSVLLNLYRDGNDSMAWHADDEKELGKNPEIASVNLGATRKFLLRHNQTREKHEILLEHGSLLVMKGAMQHHWQHQVPKTKKKVRPRINLTFRALI